MEMWAWRGENKAKGAKTIIKSNETKLVVKIMLEKIPSILHFSPPACMQQKYKI